MYNVKIIEYSASGETEFRFYSEPISNGKSKKRDTSEDDSVYVGSDADVKRKDFKDLERSMAVSMNRAKGKVYDYARANKWEYFVTLTFDPSKVDSLDYDEVTKKMAQWLNNFKKRKAPGLKYIGVPELHQSGRVHFHFLMSDIGSMKLTDSGKRSNGKKIYNLEDYKYGFTTVVRVGKDSVDNAKVSNYITKYITKAIACWGKGKKKYWCSKNLDTGKEEELYLSYEDLEEFKKSVQEKTTSAKVVDVNNPSFRNTITYFTIRNILNE